MKLHLDKDAFKFLIDNVHDITGIRTDVIEKDYYVVLFLYELSHLQNEGLPAYFKGGTALYKALKMNNRFSEDIDLTVDINNCTRTQADKRLEKASKKYVSLQRVPEQGFSHRSEIMSIYQYDPLTLFDNDDKLQRFGRVKIEATSFTISEPIEPLEVSAILYQYSGDATKKLLEDLYDVHPFSVLTITVERIFIDKLFATEAYLRRSSEKLFEAAKHLYDLAVLSKQAKIKSLLQNEILLEKLINIRLKEEMERHDGIPGIMPSQFTFFDTIGNNKMLRESYTIMQNQYVFKTQDKIPFESIVCTAKELKSNLFKTKAWTMNNTNEYDEEMEM